MGNDGQEVDEQLPTVRVGCKRRCLINSAGSELGTDVVRGAAVRQRRAFQCSAGGSTHPRWNAHEMSATSGQVFAKLAARAGR